MKPTSCFSQDQTSACDCQFTCRYSAFLKDAMRTPATQPDWKPDPRTVQACIEAITDRSSSGIVYDTYAIKTLEKLLPKPDPAKALVEEWIASDTPDAGTDKVAFARWLIDNDRIKP